MDLKKASIVLGLSPHATADEIKQAYRLKVKENHPDLAAGNPSLAKILEEKMKAINVAYHLLLMEARSRPTPPTPQSGEPKKAPPQAAHPKTAHQPNPHGPSAKGRPHAADPKKKRPDAFRSRPAAPAGTGLLTNLIKTILDRLTRLTTPTDPFPLGQKKPAKKRSPAFSERPRDFSDILNDILKAQNGHEEKHRSERKVREPYDYYSTTRNRRKKTGEKGPVESVSPVSPIKRIEGDH